jgi:hypothetical protein
MDRNRYRRITVRVTAGISLLLASIALLFFGELRRTQAEMDAVLSSLFEVVLHNVPSGHRFQIIIMREAQSPGLLPGQKTRTRWSLLADEAVRFPKVSLVTRTSFLLTNAVPTTISANLHLPKGVESVVLSNSAVEHMTRSDLLQRFPDNQNWERLDISQVGLNFTKTEAILYVDHSCAGLCGGGAYILMRKVDGVWRIAEEHVTWMS